MKKIAIIGAGVSGLGCAVKIKEAYPGFEVIVFTKDTTPHTTGDGSAGFWTPYVLGTTPENKINQWGSETHTFFHQLWREGLAGACLIPLLGLTSYEIPEVTPSWKDIVYGFRNLSKEEMERLNKTFAKKFVSGYHYITFSCEPKLLLPYLMDRFSKAGGKIIKQEVGSIAKFAENGFDVIINCSGLASKTIVPDDSVYPTRGQVARVNAPWANTVFFHDKNYIIPNVDTVVLGGTAQKNDYNLKVCPKDSQQIFEGCQDIEPGLKKASTLFEWVGLRPSHEKSVRVERSDIMTKDNKNVIVIHNYGHGGSGVTLFWGCASDVLNILKDGLNDNVKSKL